jgi:chemotaxis protein MotB
MSAEGHDSHEIIIVRHRGLHEHDGHHGGVWKIAYADFMTAMMAFFLVMWLVNASNKETKQAVASYFNPVRLVDSKTGAKGVRDLKNPSSGISQDPGKAAGDPDPGDKSAQAHELPQTQERQLFDEPYAVLAQIAGDVGVKQNLTDAGKGGAATSGAATGSSKGDAYRDPFDPNFWSTNVDPSTPPDQAQPPVAMAHADGAKTAVALASAAPANSAKAHVGGAADKAALARDAAENAGPASGKAVQDAAKGEPSTAPTKPEAVKATDATNLARAIASLNAEEHADSTPAPSITAAKVEGGVLISVTDSLGYGMFQIGSAQPDKRVVLALAAIAKLLQERKGEVIISGHTDARPFVSGNYDNWRLSSARAQMAYYMLVRGGLDPKRVLRVEGYADRQPKNPSDPNAAENRRIDIFLKTP